MARKIGVLALQGDFAKHMAMLETLGVETLAIKKPQQLEECDALIIPGGESTTLTKLMVKYGFYEPLREFSRRHPVMGTCAGAILVAKDVDDPRVQPLGLMNIAAKRNAYGRQVDSFVTDINTPMLAGAPTFPAVFIRAPKISAVRNGVEILMSSAGEPVMVQEGNILAVTFHPELTKDNRIHRYFLELTSD
ncbi:MAG: pyridoxal 5'-phosphate synthase glutaminase subunit PdxT [Deltaproteobacteria bacterium]|nr:pyridoxal 5'-phosphate synthase glutaminase subunit PdxT [Deltaproteobacteria bacterium]